ncbi:uncharacterized protein [Leptinotarsa decemlineata]|uniref:uncharacterized protein n=1 Tax=Leptinotarsa decemlineata TaxID=7539 RepID=UPI003D30D681
MVRQCQVCRKIDHLNPNLSFHRFPANLDRLKYWYSLLDFSEDKILPKTAQIFSDHFDDDCFDYKPTGVKYLRTDTNPKPVHPELFEANNSSSRVDLSSTSMSSTDTGKNFERKSTTSGSDSNSQLSTASILQDLSPLSTR